MRAGEDRIMHPNLASSPWERMEAWKAALGVWELGLWGLIFRGSAWMDSHLSLWPHRLVIVIVVILCFISIWKIMCHGFKLVVYCLLLYGIVSSVYGEDTAYRIIGSFFAYPLRAFGF